VILPFANLSGDPANDILVQGLGDDITIALGREKWLFVVASPSASAFREADIDLRDIGGRLGVRYVLRGSMRRSGGRTRIVVVLTDATNGAFITSHQIEDIADNIFDMTDRLTSLVTARIAPELRSTEIERVARKPTASLTAFEHYLKALPLVRADLASNRHALALLERATEIDPSFAAAHALAARCCQFQKMMGWVPLDDPGLRHGVAFAFRAAELGQNDSEALWMAAHAMHLLAGETERAGALLERGLTLNPNSANGWSSSCSIQTMLGQFDSAIDHFMMSQRLNPLDQSHHLHWNIVGLTYFAMGRHDEANEAADRALRVNPAYPQALRLKIATCGARGRPDEAAPHLARLRAAHPESSLTWLRGFWAGPMQRVPELYASFLEAAKEGGMPE
jgi:TolB-like protein/tetratricopeptide (TPR) repeat protein